jgi:exosortase C (VPDSG-CTERM-specific)
MADQFDTPGINPPRLKAFGQAAGILTVLFVLPLARLAVFAAHDDLHSYILLIPFVSLYLAYLEKQNLPAAGPRPGNAAWACFAGGILMVAWYWCRPAHIPADDLSRLTLGFVLLLTGLGFYLLGNGLMRALAYPFGLLIFMVPMPEFLRAWVETGLQHGSAVCAGGMFAVSDVPTLQTGLSFKLPNISLQVAPECSGIHSTMVLLITSLVAGKFFLPRTWQRTVLCLAVIPLALLRNGFRIFVLGELCTHFGPQMIDSPIHHHGGPLFFVLSLVPFLLLLYALRKYGRSAGKPIVN